MPKGSRVIHTSDNVLGGGTDYGYDEFNRLTSMNGPSQSFTYAYDRYGNRVNQTITSGTGVGLSPSYSINKNNNQIIGFSYDAAGNLTNDAVHSYTYDAEGNITQVDGGSKGQYVYDAMNRRVGVQTSGSAYEYMFDYMGHRTSSWLVQNNFGNEGRIYWDGKQIAYRAWNGTTYFDIQDGLGTERMRTDYTGAVSSTYQSLPWGDSYGPNENDPSGNAQDNLHFATLDHDSESNTEHAQFRNYSSTQGRWLSPDLYSGSYDFGNPQSFNRYAYVQNKPLSLIDPLGLTPIDCTTITYPTSVTLGQIGDSINPWNAAPDYYTETTCIVNGAGQNGTVDKVSNSGGGGGGGSASNKYCSASKYANARNFVTSNQAAAAQVANSLNTTTGNLLGLSGFESGWGTGSLAAAGTNNYFSLQAGPAFATGATGKYTLGANTFWTYSSFQASAQAFASSYFGTRVNGVTDPVAFAQAMNSGGKFNSEQRSVPYNTTLVNSIKVANGVLQCP